jgi:hypothetical protein
MSGENMRPRTVAPSQKCAAQDFNQEDAPYGTRTGDPDIDKVMEARERRFCCAMYMKIGFAIVAILCFFACVPLVLRCVIEFVIWINGAGTDDDGGSTSPRLDDKTR